MRFVALACAILGIGLLLETHMFAHYAAPATGLVFLLIVQSLRHVRLFRWRDVPVGRVVVWVFLLACVYHLWKSFTLPIRVEPAGRFEKDNCCRSCARAAGETSSSSDTPLDMSPIMNGSTTRRTSTRPLLCGPGRWTESESGVASILRRPPCVATRSGRGRSIPGPIPRSESLNRSRMDVDGYAVSQPVTIRATAVPHVRLDANGRADGRAV